MTEANKTDLVVHTEHMNKYYVMGDIEVRALHDINLDVSKGELMAIMGPSGSGKSTLMSILGCLDRPTSGKYFLNGTEVSTLTDSQLAEIRNERIGFVFQSFNLLPRSSALENVMLPLLYSKNKAHARERAAAALEKVGLGARMDHRPKEMSGGQQQRVAVARALINDPDIIMADEPTGNLDSKSGKEIMELLISLNEEHGTTVILVTHDPKIGKQVPRVVSVFDGMLGSEEEQKIIKSWQNPEYSNWHVKFDENGKAVGSIPPVNPGALPSTQEESATAMAAQIAANKAVQTNISEEDEESGEPAEEKTESAAVNHSEKLVGDEQKPTDETQNENGKNSDIQNQSEEKGGNK